LVWVSAFVPWRNNKSGKRGDTNLLPLRQSNAPKRKGSQEMKNPEVGFGNCEEKVQFPLAITNAVNEEGGLE